VIEVRHRARAPLGRRLTTPAATARPVTHDSRAARHPEGGERCYTSVPSRRCPPGLGRWPCALL
jgi:hypothetical protein